MWTLWNKLYFIENSFWKLYEVRSEIDADSGPLGYVLWCCGSRSWEELTFIQIGSGHTVCPLINKILVFKGFFSLFLKLRLIMWLQRLQRQRRRKQFIAELNSRTDNMPKTLFPSTFLETKKLVISSRFVNKKVLK